MLGFRGSNAFRAMEAVTVQLTSAELDNLYALARQEANRLHSLFYSDCKEYEPGSYGCTMIELDKKLTAVRAKLRQHS